MRGSPQECSLACCITRAQHLFAGYMYNERWQYRRHYIAYGIEGLCKSTNCDRVSNSRGITGENGELTFIYSHTHETERIAWQSQICLNQYSHRYLDTKGFKTCGSHTKKYGSCGRRLTTYYNIKLKINMRESSEEVELRPKYTKTYLKRILNLCTAERRK